MLWIHDPSRAYFKVDSQDGKISGKRIVFKLA
jgi:hypothetical protein